jgi:hypothetical protein
MLLLKTERLSNKNNLKSRKDIESRLPESDQVCVQDNQLLGYDSDTGRLQKVNLYNLLGVDDKRMILNIEKINSRPSLVLKYQFGKAQPTYYISNKINFCDE